VLSRAVLSSSASAAKIIAAAAAAKTATGSATVALAAVAQQQHQRAALGRFCSGGFCYCSLLRLLCGCFAFKSFELESNALQVLLLQPGSLKLIDHGLDLLQR
jgi:hypothetical protein